MKKDYVTLLDDPQAITADVWREVWLRPKLDDFAAAVAKLLGSYLSIGQILVRQVDRKRASILTVAVGVAVPPYLLPDARTQCTAKTLEEVHEWHAKGESVCRGASGWADTPVEVLVPTGLRGDVLVGPVAGPNGDDAVLIIASADGFTFDNRHVEIADLLLEPFAAALENDRRFHEVASLKAAAEVEKQSLLKSQGHQWLGDDTVVGAKSGLRAVVERVELVAKSDAPVLILGETGAGKEVIARLIHNHSNRTTGPFLRVNCGAIPPELIDSQLFGHERGAFTGAVDSRDGWFERADGGTLLLDEVGELPLAAQVRLLRILQDGWLEKVGGQKPIHVNVRIIAATHRNLSMMVREGKFREDLWYRIAVFPIEIPPLRERTGDIPELVEYFAEQAASRFSLPKASPTPEDIRLLTSYSWPGNIRELAAVVDRAAILGNGRRLEFAKALGVTAAMPTDLGDGGLLPTAASERSDHFPTLDEAMRRHIESALKLTHGRIEGRRGVAKILQINPHTLRARMRKLKIDWTQFRQDDDIF